MYVAPRFNSIRSRLLLFAVSCGQQPALSLTRVHSHSCMAVSYSHVFPRVPALCKPCGVKWSA